MQLLYVSEHLACKNYVSDFHIGFCLKELKKNEILHLEDKYYHYLIFILEGEINISCNEFRNHLCSQGEMIFIAQDSNVTGEAWANVKYLLLSFDNQFTLCDQVSLETLQAYERERPIFNKLDIRPPMQHVLDSIMFYLENKIQCRHLQAAKQREIFLILRAFYSKKELASFLSPIINKNLDFKTFILKNYQDVKTVDELARLCNSSVRSLTRKFRLYFNDSPYSWILKQRSKHIRSRLADTNIPIGQIVKEYGFSSPAHFTSYCKKYFGNTPSKIRKELSGTKKSVSVAVGKLD